MARRRAILTDREREILSGETDVDPKRLSVTVARVKKRIDEELEDDLDCLENGRRPDLADRVRTVVCDEE